MNKKQRDALRFKIEIVLVIVTGIANLVMELAIRWLKG